MQNTKPATRRELPRSQAVVIFKCTVKATGEIFYLIESDTHKGTYYHLTWNEQACRWDCHCPSTKPCKHERALSELQTAQYHLRIAAKQREDITRREAETRRSAPLYTREFSLMR